MLLNFRNHIIRTCYKSTLPEEKIPWFNHWCFLAKGYQPVLGSLRSKHFFAYYFILIVDI